MAGALVDPASPLDLIQCLTVGIFPREGRTGHSLGRHRSGAVGFGLLFLSRLPLVLGLVQNAECHYCRFNGRTALA